jgi:uncharacterized membrane protein
VTRGRGLLWTAIGAWTVGFSVLSILRQDAFNTGRFDMGNMVQAVWATAHGHPLQVTSLQGLQISRLASHTDAILVVFAPLWWLWPSPEMLLTAQAVAVALGALPVFWLAREHVGSERAGLGFALAYLLYPATGWLTLNEFHPVALACPLLLFAFWYLDQDRWLPFAAFAIAAAATKEEIPLVLAGFGVWYALARRRWLLGGAIAATGVAAAAVAVEVVVPHFNGAASNFYTRYESVGGSPGGVFKTAFTHPLRLVEKAFSTRGLRYLGELLVPLGGLWLLAPVALVAALPEVALNLLSIVTTQRSIHFHYTAGLIPPLFVASVLGAGRLAERRSRAAVRIGPAVAALALAANYYLGPIPFWSKLPGGSRFQSTYTHVTDHDQVAARAVRVVPPDAVVSATNSLGAHLSARRRVLSFPRLDDATWVAADETQSSYLDRIAPLPSATDLVNLRRNPDWRLVFEEDGILVFERIRHVSRSP